MWIHSHILSNSYVYSICKCANWVLQVFLRSSLVPKCDTCYLKNKCCYTYSNSKLVTLSHTYVTCLPLTNLKLSHALIKHKNFINYILPGTNHLPNPINLSQLSSSIYISQILILTISFLYNTSINLLLNKHLSFAWLVWLCLYGVFMLCYFLTIVVRRATRLVERREASCSSERQVTHISLTHFIMH
jgi:hypothetical protein